MYCLDKPDELKLHGNPGDTDGRVLFIHVFKCQGKTNCKSETEIENFIKDKQMVYIYDQ